jgi:hypothetical protein
MKYITLFLIGLVFTSCVKEAERSEKKGNYQVEFLFEKDGCKVYRFYDNRYIYYTDCDGGSSTITYHREGKVDVLDVVETK